MKKYLILVLICVSGTTGFSQSSSKIENIKKLLDLTGSGKMGAQVAQTMISSFQESYSNVPNEYWESVKKEINADDIVALVIPIYDKYYTEEDIQKLIEFYESPIGKKVISSTPLIVQESMSAGKIWGENIGKKVMEKLKQDGYIKEG
ncbi:MAG: DUF2059 domain-containing protein [Ginsengibacter sp.]